MSDTDEPATTEIKNIPNSGGGRKGAPEFIIARGLWQRPGYLLIFGLCFIGLTAGSVLATTGSNVVSITLAFSIVVGLIAAVVIILKTERPDAQLHLTGSRDVDDHLVSVSASLRYASKIAHPEFRKIVVQNCARLDGTLSDIKNGQVRLNAKDFNRKMHDVLSSAKLSVACVHRGDYLEEWFDRIGGSVIEAHAQSGASAIHVFVFDLPSQVTSEQQRLMRQLDDTGKVEVLVYFDSQDRKYQFPEAFPKDYVLLDGGEAICITTGVERDGFTGTWYFNDRTRQATYNNEFAGLKRATKKFSEAFQQKPTETGSGSLTRGASHAGSERDPVN